MGLTDLRTDGRSETVVRTLDNSIIPLFIKLETGKWKRGHPPVGRAVEPGGAGLLVKVILIGAVDRLRLATPGAHLKEIPLLFILIL